MKKHIALLAVLYSAIVVWQPGMLQAEEPKAKPDEESTATPEEESTAKPAGSQQDTATQQAASRDDKSADAKSAGTNEPQVKTNQVKTDQVKTKSKQQKAADAVIEFVEPKFMLPLAQGYSKVIRTKQPVIRVAVANPKIADVVPFRTNEVGVMGKSPGVTTVTIWVGTKEKSEVLQMLVRVERNVGWSNRRR